MGKINQKAFDEAIEQAAAEAAQIKEKNKAWKNLAPVVPFLVGITKKKPHSLSIACVGADKDVHTVVLDKSAVVDLIEPLDVYLSLIEKEAEKRQTTIYKKMEYQMRLPGYETLAEGKDGGYKWKVLSLGSHPCGYVSVPKNHPFYGKSYWDIGDKIEVHGGLTFSGKLHGFEGLWFGWDYAHAGDFTFPFTMTGDKRWSTQEIVDECLRAIEQFRSFEEK